VRTCASGAISVIVALIVSWQASAAPLAPGGSIFTPAEPDPTGGAVIGVETLLFGTGGPSGFSGTLTTIVIRDDPSNPFANIGNPDILQHGLTFVYQLKNDPTSATSLSRMTDADFSGFATDVSWQVPTLGRVPTTTDRSSGLGSDIDWNFVAAPVGLGLLDPGASAANLVIQTSSGTFVDSTAVIANSSNASALVPIYAPFQAAVPEPSCCAAVVFCALLIRQSGRRDRSSRGWRLSARLRPLQDRLRPAIPN
jgi:hypothetical protein